MQKKEVKTKNNNKQKRNQKKKEPCQGSLITNFTIKTLFMKLLIPYRPCISLKKKRTREEREKEREQR